MCQLLILLLKNVGINSSLATDTYLEAQSSTLGGEVEHRLIDIWIFIAYHARHVHKSFFDQCIAQSNEISNFSTVWNVSRMHCIVFVD
jgi:hypothetical protein